MPSPVASVPEAFAKDFANLGGARRLFVLVGFSDNRRFLVFVPFVVVVVFILVIIVFGIARRHRYAHGDDEVPIDQPALGDVRGHDGSIGCATLTVEGDDRSLATERKGGAGAVATHRAALISNGNAQAPREHDAPAEHYQVYSGEVRIGTIYKTSGNEWFWP